MLEIKDTGIVNKIIKHCYRIEKKISNVDNELFLADEDLQEIVCFNIFQIGELAKKLSEKLIEEYNKIPWKYIKGMRDIIGHGYGTIDMNRVWVTAKEDIIELRKYCEYILNGN